MDAESRLNEYYERHNYAPYLQEHHKTYLALAWAGYQQKGRGFVVLDHSKAIMDSNENIVEINVEYLTADELIAKEGPWIVESAYRVVNQYDPEAEMAIFEIIPNLMTKIGTNGTFPMRQVYKEVTAK